MNDIPNHINQKLVEDFNFFHSTRKNSFSKLVKTISKLKNFGKKKIGYYFLSLIGITAIFSFIFAMPLEFNIFNTIFFIFFTIAWSIYSLVSFLILKSKQTYLQTVLENKFSKHKLILIAPYIKQAAQELKRMDEYFNFTLSVQKGAISRSQVEFYIQMLEYIFKSKHSNTLNQENTPSYVSVNLEDDFENETLKTLNNFQDIEFFSKNSKNK